MSVVGIIAEFNPLHSGHKLLIDTAKKSGNTVVSVISGNFVQRGDTAIIPKQKRAEMALKAGVDVVAELPVLWSMSTAQNFALGGVFELASLGCDEIIFGSESSDINALVNAADMLMSDEFSNLLAEQLKSGVTFVVARQAAAKELGVSEELLRGANNNLGIEYICAAKKLNLDIKFNTIKRIGAQHDSIDTDGNFVSSSLLREKIKLGEYGFAEKFMPIALRGILRQEIVSDIKRLDNAILSHLRRMNKEDFKKLPDISEGIENKLFFSVKTAESFDDLCQSVKSKRYTLARIRRLVLSAFLDFDNQFFLKTPPYVRVLGISEMGATHLKEISNKNDMDTPIITRASQIKDLDQNAQKVFKTEDKATNLYNLSLGKIAECSSEYTLKFLKY
ncbi:MAG: nucleotidyltransferase family protein [Ruminococcaceae bacterium]|nr:nucleotidyltransferase family protein [Oscillospiraceae bacterium]